MASTMENLKQECSDRVVPLQLDVANESSVNSCAEKIKQYLANKSGSKLRGVVNNAGILVTPGPFEWTPLESYRRMMEVNIIGSAAVTKSVLPLIRESQGRIVLVASIAGCVFCSFCTSSLLELTFVLKYHRRVGLPTQPAYCAS